MRVSRSGSGVSGSLNRQFFLKGYVMTRIITLFRFYIALIKVPQTGLLLFTAVAGYRTSAASHSAIELVLAAFGMLLVISGTTALNMVFDRDIDIIMERTKNRPIPREKITSSAAAAFGIVLILAGSVFNLWVSCLYAFIVFLGLFFDLVIYTIWLKRRSPWSILFGGISGGMPILAGRVLAMGSVDIIGILLVLIILFWIPTHILTLAMNYSKDYKLAGVPTFPNVFGFENARYFIAVSNIISAVTAFIAFYMLNVAVIGLYICLAASIVLLFLSFKTIIKPGEKTYFTLFKYASIFMVGVMLILVMHAS